MSDDGEAALTAVAAAMIGISVASVGFVAYLYSDVRLSPSLSLFLACVYLSYSISLSLLNVSLSAVERETVCVCVFLKE
jgi:uncharacterized membrane protein